MAPLVTQLAGQRNPLTLWAQVGSCSGSMNSTTPICSPCAIGPATPTQRANAAHAPPKRVPWLHWSDTFTGGIAGAIGGGLVLLSLPWTAPGTGFTFPIWLAVAATGTGGALGAAAAPIGRACVQGANNYVNPARPQQGHAHWREVHAWLEEEGVCEGQAMLQGAVSPSALRGLLVKPWGLRSSQLRRLAKKLTQEAYAQGKGAAQRGRIPAAETAVYEALLESAAKPDGANAA